MLRTLLAILSCILCTISCHHPSKCESSRFDKEGKEKPLVILFPAIDSTSFDLPWSLSEEFSSLIKSRISHKDDLFLVPSEGFKTSSENPFGLDIAWMKNSYPAGQYLVFVELVEHKPTVVQKRGAKLQQVTSLNGVSYNLGISARLRIIDNRGKEPKILLQELIKDSYYVPKTILPTDYNRITWGTKDYNHTPMGSAHRELAKDIAERIEEYLHMR